MAEPLWSDERIVKEIRNAMSEVIVYSTDLASFVVPQVLRVARDIYADCATELDAANATIAELQDALNGMRGIAQQRLDRVRELEAQLAEQWEPVEDGNLSAVLIKGLERYQRQIGRAAIQGWYKPDAAHGEVAYIEVLINALRGSEDAPPTLKLFRRVREGDGQ